MFTFEYKNAAGTLLMRGDGSGIWNITDIEGLGMVDKNVTSVTFGGEHGRLTTESVLRERTITVTGDIVSSNLTAELSRAISILSREGDIVVNGNRLIHCENVIFPDPKRTGTVAKFTMQFVCDRPYFGETEEINVPVLSVDDHLAESFVLPMAFSTITTYGLINVTGESETAPFVYITNFGDDDQDSITLINSSTGKSISLNYFPEKNETVEIDIDKRRVKGSISGNLIHFLAPETRLADFYLACGENIISLKDNFNSVMVTVKYRNKYASAIY